MSNIHRADSDGDTDDRTVAMVLVLAEAVVDGQVVSATVHTAKEVFDIPAIREFTEQSARDAVAREVPAGTPVTVFTVEYESDFETDDIDTEP